MRHTLRKNNPSTRLLILTLCFFCSGFSLVKPNIVIILADDMGYGDVKAMNALAKTTTPQLDRLADSGMIFTNAHASGSSCIISRFGLMTGQYPMRRATFNYDLEPLIDTSQWTIASVLKRNGYRTGMVGKWHLGFNYASYNNLTDGPVDRGFDFYYGLSRSLDQNDYYFIHGRKAVAPTVAMPASAGYGQNGWQGPFWRAGTASPGFIHAEVLNNFTDTAISFINRTADSSLPFLLYLAYPSPHTPWLPSVNFRGTSPIGEWGDWIAENDAAYGRVVQAIYNKGLKNNTLIIFTSDNGPVWWPIDITTTGHQSAGIYRGMKFDPWEGGHRMPFIASWPGIIQKGSRTNQLISNTDFLATFAAMVCQPLPDNVAEDSYNIWPALLNSNLATPVRGPFLELPAGGSGSPLVVINGDWKLIEQGNQLYNLRTDPSETNNVYAANPTIVAQLRLIISNGVSRGYTVPHPRTNTCTIFGCMNMQSPNYDPMAVAEPIGACLPTTGISNSSAHADQSWVINRQGSLQVLSAEVRSIVLKTLQGRVIYSIRNPGMRSYDLSKLSHRGMFLVEVEFRSGSVQSVSIKL